MQFSTSLILLAVGLDCALAQPHRHHVHKHRDLKDVNWDDPSNYVGVDWKKVDYSGGKKPGHSDSAPAVHAAPLAGSDNPAPSPAPPASSPSPKPKPDQEPHHEDPPAPASPDNSSGGVGKGFGGRTDPVDNGNKDEYKGNVGIPYGSNMIKLDNPDDIKNFKYSITFTNGGNDKISVALWNKGGSDGRPQSGMALPPHMKFDLDVGQNVAVVFDENSQVGFAKDGQRNQYGLLTTAWGEADFGDLRNQGWSGYDRSTIVQGANDGLLTMSCKGAKTSSQHGNSFLTAAQTDAGGALPPGPVHIKTQIG